MKTNVDFLIIKKARNGRGVFTKKNIKKNETIFELKGRLLSVAEIEAGGIFSTLSANAYRFSKEMYLSPTGELGDFINHSCDPNAYIKKENEKLYIIAIKLIHSGEEITIDYSTIMAPDDEWNLSCNCGSKICRNKVEKFMNLPKNIQKKYKKNNIVPAYILKK